MAEKRRIPDDWAGLTREEARAREEDFHGRFRAKLQFLREVVNPLDGRLYFPDPSTKVVEWDDRDKVKRLMIDSGILDRSVRRRMPVNKGARFDLGVRGIFSGFTPSVSLASVSLSPLASFSSRETSRDPIEFPELDEAVKTAADRPRIFQYVAVFATTFFSDECLDNIPSSRNYSALLLERGRDTVWSVFGAESSQWSEAVDFLDLETIPEKIERGRLFIINQPDLRMKGGHVELDDLKTRAAIPGELFDRSLETVLAAEDDFCIREIDGVKILQRARF